jgi:adenosylmethionine---8-amino-7-oxononanoate aminotransferase
LASLDILLRPETLQQIQMIEQTHCERIHFLQSQTGIEKLRICGTIAAFDLTMVHTYGSSFSVQLRDQFLSYGMLLRPLGNVIYLLPPYCISQTDLCRAYDAIDAVMKQNFIKELP